MTKIEDHDGEQMQPRSLTLEEGFTLAQQLHQNGRFSEARALYVSILKVVPDHPQTLHFYGLLSHQMGDSRQGIALIEKALVSQPDYADAYNNLGNIYRTQQRTDLAECAYRKVIELVPEHAAALNNLGAIYNEWERLPEALAAYDRAALAAPNRADVRYNLGNVYSKQQRWEAAAKAYQLATELDPEMAIAYRALGKALTRLQRDEQALKAIQRAVELSADHAETHCELGHSLQIKGLLEDAAAAYRRAISLKPDYGDAYEHAAGVLYKLDRLEDACDIVQQWLSVDPENPVTRHMAAAILGKNVPERAADDYVQSVFDAFAETFEAQLERLQYKAPTLLVEQLAKIGLEPIGQLQVLDAGCGTGLCGPLLRPYSKWLIGVDLSAGMLKHAERRGGYDELAQAELTTYLQQHTNQFDLILSADTLVYFGFLERVFEAAAKSLRIDGWLVFSVEQGSNDVDYAIGPHGRYSHRESYLRNSLERSGFSRISLQSAVLRTEASKPVKGWLAVAVKT